MGNELYVTKKIERVMIIDDMPDVRESIAEKVGDLNLIALPENDIILSLESCIKKVQSTADAAIFDYHLSKRNYANFKGIEAVVKLYKLAIPVLLATSFINADKTEIQMNKQYIPVIIKSSEINSDTIIQGFEFCQNEFAGNFSPERKPWRSLIRVEDISEDKKFVYVVVPSWDTSEKISLPISILPEEYKLSLEPDLHFFAQVNVDAERYEDLYFHSFEPIKQLREKYARFIHS